MFIVLEYLCVMYGDIIFSMENKDQTNSDYLIVPCQYFDLLLLLFVVFSTYQFESCRSREVTGSSDQRCEAGLLAHGAQASSCCLHDRL